MEIIITLHKDLQQPISLRRAQRLAGSTNIYLSISLSLSLSLSLCLVFTMDLSATWCPLPTLAEFVVYDLF